MFSAIIDILLTINVGVSLLIILLVLMQRPKSEGLGAAFGGGMTENLFGAQTSNVLANATRWLGGIFFGLTLLLSILYARQSMQKSLIQQTAVQKALAATPAPAASPAASPSEKAVVSPSAAPVATATPTASATPASTVIPSATPGTTPAPTTTGSAGH